MDLLAAAAGDRVTRMSLSRAGREQLADAGRSDLELRGLNDFHRERADASVRRTRLGATTCVSRRGTCRVTTIAGWDNLGASFLSANRERFGARFDLLRHLILENDLLFRRYR